MSLRDPNKIFINPEERSLARIKAAEKRLENIERRGSSAQWDGGAIPAHADRHEIDGNDPITPAMIGAATAAQVSTIEGDVTTLQSDLAALPTSYAETITGDSVETDFTITHNKGTRDLVVQIREVASPYAQVSETIEHTSTNAITVKFASAPGTGVEYRVMIIAF